MAQVCKFQYLRSRSRRITKFQASQGYIFRLCLKKYIKFVTINIFVLGTFQWQRACPACTRPQVLSPAQKIKIKAVLCPDRKEYERYIGASHLVKKVKYREPGLTNIFYSHIFLIFSFYKWHYLWYYHGYKTKTFLKYGPALWCTSLNQHTGGRGNRMSACSIQQIPSQSGLQSWDPVLKKERELCSGGSRL